jgi:hypothetical protein
MLLPEDQDFQRRSLSNPKRSSLTNSSTWVRPRFQEMIRPPPLSSVSPQSNRSRDLAQIEFGVREEENEAVFLRQRQLHLTFVDGLFSPFQRLHYRVTSLAQESVSPPSSTLSRCQVGALCVKCATNQGAESLHAFVWPSDRNTLKQPGSKRLHQNLSETVTFTRSLTALR